MNKQTKTSCPYCGVGCGVIATTAANGVVTVEPDPDHPANLGRLCSKGAALDETLGVGTGRLLYPEVRGQETSWDDALGEITQSWSRIIEEYGPGALAFYASGQMLTEDYYVANKLMKGYIGSANIDTNSRLCMSSAVAAHVRAFGVDGVACNYTDLEQTDLLVLIGSNLAWCHPVLYQRIKRARQQRPQMKVVVVDPRKTDTCEIADLHLPLKPDTDLNLLNGLLSYLADHEALDKTYIDSNTNGFPATLIAARTAGNLGQVAASCGLDSASIEQLYEWFAGTDRIVTAYSMGVNQSRIGTDKASAIINLHLATGKIGRSGCGPFSITGQPNAMGGREVGGLATTLAAHMGFSETNCDRLQQFWQSPTIARAPGLKALDLFEAIETGQVRSVWIMATNPAVSLPDADRWRRALEKCDCVIVSDCVSDTDTLTLADIKLPALGWGEKSGTVTNSERRISRQRAFLPAPGEAKPDWWAVCQVAKRLGFGQGFNYESARDIFVEHAALSGYENNGERDFDIAALAGVDSPTYEELEPFQWPLNGSGKDSRLYGDGKFYTDSGRASLIPTVSEPVISSKKSGSLCLITGRVRDQWHTLTRTGLVPRLSAHQPEPYLSIHPSDALSAGIKHETLLKLTSDHGKAILRARLSESMSRGQVFAPMHWSNTHSPGGAVNRLLPPLADPASGEPGYKNNPVHLEPLPIRWSGVLLTRDADLRPPMAHWVKVRCEGYYRYMLAALEEDCTPNTLWQKLCKDGDELSLLDHQNQVFRFAALSRQQRLESVLFAGSGDQIFEIDWVGALFKRSSLSTDDRKSVLSGFPPAGTSRRGRTLCSCKNVGINEVINHVHEGLHRVVDITKACQAGGGCGSCIPEIQRLIDTEIQSTAQSKAS